MCRAVGIPSRAHYVTLHADVLRGFVNPGPYVNHAFSEVFISDRWVKVDSYTVDKQLAARAKVKLAQEGSVLGYGVHIDGKEEWDGSSDNFIQFVNNGKFKNLTTEDLGSYNDSQEFGSSGKGIQYNVISRGIMYLALQYANSVVQSFRTSSASL